jgi:acyl carrier protein
MTSDHRDQIHEIVLRVVAATTKNVIGPIADDEDVFTKCSLNSMEIVSVLVALETTFDVVLGEDASEFPRMRTFAGLCGLLRDKLPTEPASPREGLG